MMGCGEHKLVADMSATWSVGGALNSHTEALDLIQQSYMDNNDTEMQFEGIFTIEEDTDDLFSIKYQMTAESQAEFRALLANEPEPHYGGVADWYIYELAGSTEKNGDITIRHRVFVPEDFTGYDNMTNEARADLARGPTIQSYSRLGYPISGHFHYPDLGKFPKDDD